MTRGERLRVPVVAAVVARRGAYLVGRRPPGKRHAGCWEFPGGKVLSGETREEAIRRELREELGMDVARVGEAVYTTSDPGTEFDVAFIPVQTRGEPRALEHSAVRWASIDDLRRLEMAPSDAEFVRNALLRRCPSESPLGELEP